MEPDCDTIHKSSEVDTLRAELLELKALWEAASPSSKMKAYVKTKLYMGQKNRGLLAFIGIMTLLSIVTIAFVPLPAETKFTAGLLLGVILGALLISALR